ncbi:MAG: prenyltransferase/squalene oxidase repeat-containing protein [Pirellulaceae bacterium]
MPRTSPPALLVLFSLLVLATPLESARPEQSSSVDQRRQQQITARGISYLRTKGQQADGSFSGETGPGITALVTTALLRNGVPSSDPMVASSLKYLGGFIQPSGGIHQEGTLYRNYETCLAMLCFNEANSDGRYDETIKKADAFIKGIQWDDDEGAERTDPGFGGAGYGKHNRPDLSNTTFFIEALKAAGNDADSEAVKRALAFVSRCQNLESEHNTTSFPAKNPDGGFYYTPAAGGTSQAGTTENGGLRSYASMTYAGLKSMIYAGVDADDPRVAAAVNWISENYDLTQNPGLGDAGHYYYLHTFAKALSALGQDEIEDARGKKHAWRSDLIMELLRRQRRDGSWVNRNTRWLEGDANLVSGYALLALSYCQPTPDQE